MPSIGLKFGARKYLRGIDYFSANYVHSMNYLPRDETVILTGNSTPELHSSVVRGHLSVPRKRSRN